MKVLVIGGTSFIGSNLVTWLRSRGYDVDYTTRATLDLLDVPPKLKPYDVVFICAAKTRLIDCEDDPTAYRINVDAPVAIAKSAGMAKIVMLSTEAVERALNLKYAHMKETAETRLMIVCDPVIVRLSKVTPDNLDACCDYLASLVYAEPGLYHWNPTTTI